MSPTDEPMVEMAEQSGETESEMVMVVCGEDQTSLKWDSTIAVLSGTLAPAGTFLKKNDKICPAEQ